MLSCGMDMKISNVRHNSELVLLKSITATYFEVHTATTTTPTNHHSEFSETADPSDTKKSIPGLHRKTHIRSTCLQ